MYTKCMQNSVSFVFNLCPIYYLMSNMNLRNACNIQYYESLFMSNIFFLCPTWIYRMNVTFSFMNFYSYVQHESTKCIQHSVLCIFILCPPYYFMSNICATYHFMSNTNLQNTCDIQYYEFLFLCPTYYFMSNMNLRNACNIHYHAILFYVQHTNLCPTYVQATILCPT